MLAVVLLVALPLAVNTGANLLLWPRAPGTWTRWKAPKRRFGVAWKKTVHLVLRHHRGSCRLPLQSLAHEVAEEIGLDPYLLRALIETESTWNPHAVSRVGAMGLGQLMPATAAWLGVEDPFSAEANLRGAARYLKRNLDRFGSIDLALAAYNAGPGAVAKHKGVPPYPQTRAYIRNVKATMRRLRPPTPPPEPTPTAPPAADPEEPSGAEPG